jgi:adenylate kinase family enzyme
VHLDRHYWQPGWVEPTREVWRETVARLADEPAWVMDGNYSATWDLRLPKADVIVWLNRPRWLCLSRVVLRSAAGLGGTRPDMAPGCPEKLPDRQFLQFIWDYPARSIEPTRRAIAALRPDQKAFVLESGRAARAFAAGLPGTLTGAAA